MDKIEIMKKLIVDANNDDESRGLKEWYKQDSKMLFVGNFIRKNCTVEEQNEIYR